MSMPDLTQFYCCSPSHPTDLLDLSSCSNCDSAFGAAGRTFSLFKFAFPQNGLFPRLILAFNGSSRLATVDLYYEL